MITGFIGFLIPVHVTVILVFRQNSFVKRKHPEYLQPKSSNKIINNVGTFIAEFYSNIADFFKK